VNDATRVRRSILELLTIQRLPPFRALVIILATSITCALLSNADSMTCIVRLTKDRVLAVSRDFIYDISVESIVVQRHRHLHLLNVRSYRATCSILVQYTCSTSSMSGTQHHPL